MGKNKIIKYEKGQLQKLNETISLTNKLLGIDYRNLFVVHLDDHRITGRRVVKITLIEKLPNIQIAEFVENMSALSFIKECFQKRKRIDLIITDYNHPGENGLVFANKVRELEFAYSIKIPIILLTMRWGDEILNEATKLGIFSIYKPKSIDPDELVGIVKNLTTA